MAVPRQHKPIGTRDCKHGTEFEIKTDNSLGLITLPPSRHRDDRQIRYHSIGQTQIKIIDKMYDKLLKILDDCLRPASSNRAVKTDLIIKRKTLKVKAAVIRIQNMQNLLFRLLPTISCHFIKRVIGQASTPTTVQNANPTVEVQRSTTTQPPITGPRPETCTQCFDMLNATHKQAINQTLAGDPNILESIVWPAGITTLENV